MSEAQNGDFEHVGWEWRIDDGPWCAYVGENRDFHGHSVLLTDRGSPFPRLQWRKLYAARTEGSDG